MQPFLIAAVVPVYNRATTVLQTLESIAAQTLPPRRLLVVDDGSRDGSAESVERWIASRSLPFEARVVRQANGGVSSARNCALRQATDTPWLAFLDSDDCWPVDFLARAAVALAAQPKAIAASADRLFVEVETGAERLYDTSELAAGPAMWMLAHGAAVCSCSVVRADAVRAAGGFPEQLATGEDAALFLPLSLRGSWLHLPGTPVRFLRQAPKRGGEEAALSRKFIDNQRRWARVYEAFFTTLSRRDFSRMGKRARICRLLSERWRRAAEELERHRQWLAAARCYTRSIRWRPGRWDRWRPLMRMPWTALSGPPRRAA
ncbi:MAG: glycosyltransferase family 2 protein [Pirellulaceae bacterium]